jgi:protein-tyrosine phosphatase
MLRLAVIFALLAAGCVVNGALKHGSLWWCWPAVAFGIVAIAYAGAGPGVYGKDARGRLSRWRGVALLPYLMLSWVIWYVRRAIGREPVAHEIAPGVWLGRRPFARELPSGIECVVDLTSEFPGVRTPPGVEYITFPTLDYGPPSEKDLRAAVERIGDRRVYLHCAMGRGRSAALAAALLVRRGLAPNVYAAEEMIRRVRPCVHMTHAQKAAAAQATVD